MYNEEQKRRFMNHKIKELVSEDDSLIKFYFKKVEPFENMYKKDVCNFTISEISDMYKFLNFISINTLINFNCQLSIYARWAMSQGLVTDNQDHFQMFDTEALLKLINPVLSKKKIMTREEVLNYVDQLLNPRDQYFLLGIFEFGSGPKNYNALFKAKMNDINEDNKTIYYDNCTLHISDELLDICYECLKTNTYYYETDNLDGSKRTNTLYNIGNICKSFMLDPTDKSINRNVYTSIIKALKYLDIEHFISPKDFENSGKLHMIKTNANKLNISIEEYLYTHKKEVEYQYRCSKINVKNWLFEYGDYI